MSSLSRSHPYGGIYASTLCPMSVDGAIDETALGVHLEAVLAVDGMAGLLVNGHAGENAFLREDELTAVVRVARAVAGPGHVVAGVSAEGIEVAARMASDCAGAGADAIMVIPPFSWALGADERLIETYHRTVATAAGCPIFLFQGSINSGLTAFSDRTLSRLLEIESVVGIKEGSWETAAYDRTRRLTGRLRPDVAVMASGDEHLFACFVLGSEGSLVSIAAVVPELIVALDRAVLAGDLTAARSIHERLHGLASVVYAAPGHMATLRLKTCLNLLGRLHSVASRTPIARLTEEETQTLASALDSAGVL